MRVSDFGFRVSCYGCLADGLGCVVLSEGSIESVGVRLDFWLLGIKSQFRISELTFGPVNLQFRHRNALGGGAPAAWKLTLALSVA